nr:integrase, catalytic region, zinc finger, CCHC-type, peptidase aspartic, catalytic [Tanacetum cinerariifolium]
MIKGVLGRHGAKWWGNVGWGVRRALFTSPLTKKSSILGATPVVAKSRFSVAPPQMQRISGFSKHMTSNLKPLRNFIENCMGTVCFGNDHFVAITRYRDYVQGNLTICHVYYVEGCRHNLFSVGKFCDGDLEVAFRSNTCYVWNLEVKFYYMLLVIRISTPSLFLIWQLHLPSGRGFKNDHQGHYSNSIEYASSNSEDTLSSSSIIVDDNEAPQIVSSSEEPIADELATPVSDDITNESIQEDTIELDENTFINIMEYIAIKGWPMFFFSVTLIAFSSSKLSSTKGDALEGGGFSSNVTLSDSLTFLVCLLRMM